MFNTLTNVLHQEITRLCDIMMQNQVEAPIFNLAVLTISDMGARGDREDTSGQAIQEMMSAEGFQVVHQEVVPDEQDLIAETLQRWSDSAEVDLILTTGGTGLGHRDVTPEATASVVQRPVPGIAEALRMETLKFTPMAMLSRSVAGVRGRCLIINLPGSPKGVRECLQVVLPVLPHALELLRGEARDHPTGVSP